MLSLNFQDFVSVDGEKLTTDSLRVAAVHHKRHDDVLRLVRNRLADAGDWGLRNFAETSYRDEQGRPQPMFVMTKDGYVFLVGRMTGKKAVEQQIAYIEAFNAMEAYIKNQREGLAYRKARHDLACADSERRGTFHGRGLNERKVEKAALDAEEVVLRLESEPTLPGFH